MKNLPEGFSQSSGICFKNPLNKVHNKLHFNNYKKKKKKKIAAQVSGCGF